MNAQSIENQEGIYPKSDLLNGINQNYEKSLIRSISNLIDSKFNNNLLKSSSKKNQKLYDEIDVELYVIIRKEETIRTEKNKKKVEDLLQHTKLNLLPNEDKGDIQFLTTVIKNGGLIEKVKQALLNGDSNPYNSLLLNLHIEKIISDLTYKIEKLDS